MAGLRQQLARVRAQDRAQSSDDDGYKWVALANTTAAVFMSQLDGSIVLSAMPAIFRGIHLDPLASGNISYLLWMIMGYRLVQAVLVVTVGRLGDMFGRVRIYTAGFLVFTIASMLLSFDPLDQVAGLSGQLIDLVAGGLLAALDWRAVFWVNVPVGIFATVWAYRKLRDNAHRGGGRIDWWGNVTFAVGLSAILIAVTYGIQPYGGHSIGWTNPWIIGSLAGGVLLLAAFAVIETRVAEPMFEFSLYRIRAFTAGNVAAFAVSIARGGLQFMSIIWLQGIWLPLHGYSYSQTPLYAGIFLLPLTAGFIVSGPTAGFLSDRVDVRALASAGMVVFGASFIGLLLLPVSFPYWIFALLIAANGIGGGMFAAPNTSSMMSSVPARYRGVASGRRATFQNSGAALSIGMFFSLMIAGVASSLPTTLTSGLQRHGVSPAVAQHIGSLPPVSSLLASVLGVNPQAHLLAVGNTLTSLPAQAQRVLTGREFFPDLISGPFTRGWWSCSSSPRRCRRWPQSRPCCAAGAIPIQRTTASSRHHR